mmetsp:Transcript_65855/g.122891  ORF Transcript_65855/g.122891 Transcript_65855/m.122891 type:complete len:465 (-) Transcript_65855:16-1410(-)
MRARPLPAGHPGRLGQRLGCLLVLLCITTLHTFCSARSLAKSFAFPTRAKQRSKVVVVGGGFAGLAVTRHLRRDFDVTLVDRKDYFEFSPGMPRPYADPAYYDGLFLDYPAVCKAFGAKWIQGTALRVEAPGRLVVQRRTKKESGAAITVPFDYCVIASGCGYGAPVTIARSARPPSKSLWEPSDADECTLSSRQTRIQQEFETLAKHAKRGDHVCIVGAGLIGVEFATELRHHFPNLRVSVLDRGESCCRALPPRARAYIQRYLDRNNITCVYGQDIGTTDPATAAEIWEGEDLPAPARVYVCAGMLPPGGFLQDEAYTESGWLRVLPTLQVALNTTGDAISLLEDGRVFAIGNCVGEVCDFPALPKNSFPAEEMAAVAARNIRRLDKGKHLKPLRWRWLGTLVALGLGPHDGVLVGGCSDEHLGHVLFRGRVVSWLKEIIRWSKVSECKGGLFGTLMWHFVH